MKFSRVQSGFSAVELLITLFIAAAFLISGYQLYTAVIKDGGEARIQTRANNVANDYLQRYKSSAANPCSVITPFAAQSIPVTGLSGVTEGVAITCPYGPSSTVSKITSTLTYGSPVQTIIDATYVSP